MSYRPFFYSTAFGPAALGRDFQKLFDEVFPDSRAASSTQKDNEVQPEKIEWTPRSEAHESDTAFTFYMDLPGVAPESVEVLASEGVLTIRGNRPTRELEAGEKALFNERSLGSFARRFRVPKQTDLSKIKASYANGVLTVQVNKTEPAQPVRVPVSVSVESAGN